MLFEVTRFKVEKLQHFVRIWVFIDISVYIWEFHQLQGYFKRVWMEHDMGNDSIGA